MTTNKLGIWLSDDQSRTFLIQDNVHLPIGEFAIRTATGRQQFVDPAALAPYEITRTEAEAWLKAQLGDVLGELRGNIIDAARAYVDRHKPSAHESPAELVEHAAAIETVADWMRHLSTRAETRLRAKATALREQAETASSKV